MLWLFLLYIPATWLLYELMKWHTKSFTTFSFAILILYACGFSTVGPILAFFLALAKVKHGQ